MDLKICCDKKVELEGYDKIIEINANVMKYKIDGQLLNGTISLDGKYKNLDNQERNYHEEVPFTIVFKNEDYQIDNIKISNFKQYDIVNVGLECNFDIIVEYNNKTNNGNYICDNNCNYCNDFVNSSENNIDDSDNKTFDSQNLALENQDLCDSNNLCDLNIEKQNLETLDELYLDNQDSLDSKSELLEEELHDDKDLCDMNLKEIELEEDTDAIDEIKDQYEVLLNEIFNKRCSSVDDFDSSNDSEVKSNDKIVLNNMKDSEVVNLNNMKDSFATITIYFINHENEIEKISKDEKISLNTIYQNACNKDYINKKRIIIN